MSSAETTPSIEDVPGDEDDEEDVGAIPSDVMAVMPVVVSSKYWQRASKLASHLAKHALISESIAMYEVGEFFLGEIWWGFGDRWL
jgi:hypothetical protein